jgi:hypothetical protein
MKDLSRRDFGKSVSVGALGGLAASSVAQLAHGQGASAPSFKRMTTVLREMINGPGVIPSDLRSHYGPDCRANRISMSRLAW